MAVQIQITLSCSHLHHEIGWHFVVEADVPLVACITTETGALVGTPLFHDKLALITTHVVAHLGLPLRDVVGEICLHELVCAAGDVQLSCTHLQIGSDSLGVLRLDRFGLALHLSDLLPSSAGLRPASSGEECCCGHHEDRENHYYVTCHCYLPFGCLSLGRIGNARVRRPPGEEPRQGAPVSSHRGRASHQGEKEPRKLRTASRSGGG